MAHKVFVSFNFADRAVVGNVRSFFQTQGGPCQGHAVFVENDVSKDGPAAIDREIKRVLADCDCALFVVGDNSHNSPWINREAELATSAGLPIVTVQAPRTSGGLPGVLTRVAVKANVDWTPAAICDALNKSGRTR